MCLRVRVPGGCASGSVGDGVHTPHLDTQALPWTHTHPAHTHTYTHTPLDTHPWTLPHWTHTHTPDAMVDKRAVRILLECFLVSKLLSLAAVRRTRASKNLKYSCLSVRVSRSTVICYMGYEVMSQDDKVGGVEEEYL